MKAQDRGGFQDDRDPGQPTGAHEQRTKAGDPAIAETEAWRTLPGAIENQQLLLDELGTGPRSVPWCSILSRVTTPWKPYDRGDNYLDAHRRNDL